MTLGAIRWAVIGLALSQGGVVPVTAPQPSLKRVAITIDDLPVVSRNFQTAADHDRITRQLVDALGSHRVPAIGFVNEGKMYRNGAVDSAEVGLLRQWTQAGLELGNHTYAHLDLHSAPIAEYLDGIVRGDVITRAVLAEQGKTPRYFRHPFLHTGRSLGNRARVDSVLAQRGYRVAPVTIDNSDYMYAALYTRPEFRERVRKEYVAYMESVTAFFEARSVEVVGREIPQVLLIHASEMNADLMPDLLAMFTRRGYRFVTLDQALADPAYRLPENYVGGGGFSWIHRWSRAKGMPNKGEPEPPPWVRDGFARR